MIVVIVAILSLHFFVFWWKSKGVESIIKSTLENSKSQNSEPNNFTIIVPFRNELKNLPNLIQGLKSQKTDDFTTSVIFINDHSTDDSVSLLNTLIKDDFPFPNKILHLDEGNGKKQALYQAANSASTKFIIQIDSDVLLSEQWLESIIRNTEQDTDLLVLPVQITDKVHWFQELEFSALQFITFGMAGNGYPILCNGANLVYKRSAWLTAFEAIKKGDSGDDIFLLQNFLLENRKIVYKHSPDLIVTTNGESKFGNFIQQRIRWAGKNQNVSIPTYKLSTLYHGVMQILPFIVCGLHWKIGLMFIILKTTIDYYFISKYNKACGKKSSFLQFIISGGIMPFYLITLLLGIIFVKPKWKGRIVNV